jgi:chemosensory pili system protein ChpA (sensor histidine kinase/response regulator)
MDQDAFQTPRTAGGTHDLLRGSSTVLVAEDDPELRLLLTTLLVMRGYRVAEARDGQETLDVARAVRPDLILMDLQLPRLNGFAVTRFVRQTDGLRRIPIIVVSAHDPAKHRNLALAAGCNAYVQKPVDFDALDEMILKLLRKD